MATDTDSFPNADSTLVARCRTGEPLAWSQFFELYHDFVRRSARRLGTPEAELDDVVQEAFTVAFKHLARFQDGKMTTWLFRLVANVVSNRHRARRVREAFLSLIGSLPEVHAPSPENRWEAQEAHELVSRVVSRMSPKKREVFVLFELEGLSGEQVSEMVGCTVATVWTRLHHARKDFARLVRRQAVLP